MKNKQIDLNCDMGESFGAWTIGSDEALMDMISSANIACGFHAGDASIMRQTASLALQKNVAIGAHPAFPDLQGFGRRNMQLSSQEVYDICVYQIGAMFGTVRALGGKLHHVKPHGALYNMAAKDPNLAKAIAEATKAIHPDLILYGLSGSHLISEAEKIGLKTASEVFADRTYQNDGSLTPRTQANAMIEHTQDAINQVIMMIEKQCVISTDGREVPLKAETICIHGDGVHAVEFATELRKALFLRNIQISTV
ncbi:5-oxoprolinase subunit PxpA [Emticicia sp. SJ17W-69]|uniref:5-oxoprolinase subunit PxpA n=1 Tax=Emticicia sp. SJ17W-69 TaxID=3421657 RepID=UPI003EB873C4